MSFLSDIKWKGVTVVYRNISNKEDGHQMESYANRGPYSNSQINNVSFWPMGNFNPPYFVATFVGNRTTFR